MAGGSCLLVAHDWRLMANGQCLTLQGGLRGWRWVDPSGTPPENLCVDRYLYNDDLMEFSGNARGHMDFPSGSVANREGTFFVGGRVPKHIN